MTGRAVLASDLSGVVLDFQPRRVMATRVGDDVATAFFAEVATKEWFGRSDVEPDLSAMCAAAAATKPMFAECLRLWAEEYVQFYVGLLPGAEQFLDWAAGTGVKTYAASNAPAGLWPQLLARFPPLRSFDGVLLSGDVGVAKPSARFFDLLAELAVLGRGDRLLFLDDRADHCSAARRCGFDAFYVHGPSGLRGAGAEAWLRDCENHVLREEC